MTQPSLTDQYREQLTLWGNNIGSQTTGFFGPNSLVWRVNQEAILHIGGPRALLLQMAHPMVAQGVADHSNFREDFWGRAIRTFTTVYSMVFGTRDHAIEASARIHAVHKRIVGTLTEDVGRFKAGTPYEANDPNLLRWVYATLVDSALIAYRDYVQPKRANMVDLAYAEMRTGAPLFGVSTEDLAPTWAEFRAWMDATIASDEIEVGSVGGEIAQHLLAGPPGLTAFAPAVRVMCAGMLPPKLRLGFGLTWDRKTRVAYAALNRTLRHAVRRVPSPLRTVPIARSARRRCRRARRAEQRSEWVQRFKVAVQGL